MELTKEEKNELNRILDSFQGRLDNNLIRLIMELIFKNKVSITDEDNRLFSLNLDRIPDKSIQAFSTGSFFGQTYQIGLDLAKKMELKLDANQKRLVREFVLFLVLFKFEKESQIK